MATPAIEHSIGDTSQLKIAIPCDMGSDDLCISHFGEASCCMLLTVIDMEPDVTPN